MCRRNKHAIGPSETYPGIACHAMDFQSKQQFIFTHEAIEASLACPESRPFHYQPVIHQLRVGNHGLGDMDAGAVQQQVRTIQQGSNIFVMSKANHRATREYASGRGMKSSGQFLNGGTPSHIDQPIPLCCVIRSEEHTSELQSLMRISYDVF